MAHPLPCRSVAEAHMFLDLIGCDRRERHHRLEDWDDTLISVYVCMLDGEPRTFWFESPENPLIEGFGGDEPSQIIDPGQFILRADRLSKSVPSNPGDLDPSAHSVAAQRLDEAADCIDEVIKFIPEGEHQVPQEAFFTPIGKVSYMEEPGRFRRARLEAVGQTYREIAARFKPQ
ncbi:MAG: hypothetical protein JRJ84_22245 [Deltaproteobacteria bacterium]|nr:hypothetical protein [Deltaproteobacteria bacterium]